VRWGNTKIPLRANIDAQVVQKPAMHTLSTPLNNHKDSSRGSAYLMRGAWPCFAALCAAHMW
jgi:hypothetical protein